jgi:predicted ester cyclase
MTRGDLQARAEQYLETWQQRDPPLIAGFHAIDGVVQSPIYATLRGRKAIEDASRAFFASFPDATLEADAIVIDPPRVAVFTTVNATHMNDFFGMPGTNRRIEFRNARLMLWDEQGLIAHERRIYDFTGLLVQLGVLRAKPAKPS